MGPTLSALALLRISRNLTPGWQWRQGVTVRLLLMTAIEAGVALAQAPAARPALLLLSLVAVRERADAAVAVLVL